MATVCFDLDDTLYCEMDFVRSGYRAVARLLAGDSNPNEEERYYALICAHRPRGFEAAIDLYPELSGRACPYSVDALVEHYRAHTPQISLAPAAEETLKALSAAGHRLVLITDGSTRHQRSKIRALGLDKFFAPKDILISEETGGDKTTTVPWSMIERNYGTKGDRWYIGDNMSKDFYLPKQRGWHTVMLLDSIGANVFPQRPGDWAAEYKPQTTITTLASLTKLIH